MEEQPQIPPEAAAPLRTLIRALREKRPLVFNGEALVAFKADVPDSELWAAQAEMVLDGEDLAAIEDLVRVVGVCRSCGCTVDCACVWVTDEGHKGQTCGWAEPDLCTACVPDADDGPGRWIHPDEQRERAAA